MPKVKNFETSNAKECGILYQVGAKSAYLERRNSMFGEVVILFSYTTPVAIYFEKSGKYARTERWYSLTTTRHTNAFCKGETFKFDQDMIDEMILQLIRTVGSSPVVDLGLD